MNCGVMEVSREKRERLWRGIVDEEAYGRVYWRLDATVWSGRRVDRKRKLSRVSKLDLDHNNTHIGDLLGGLKPISFQGKFLTPHRY